MVDRVLNATGGLHNRTTEHLHLQPFTLREVRTFLRGVNPVLNDYQIVQLYRSLGGIPHYLQHVRRGESTEQIVNRLCFNRDGILRHEFENLYAALFERHERHLAVVRTLATTRRGLTRREILAATKLKNGSAFTKILRELTASSFISEMLPLGNRKRDARYRLVDEYSLFYLTFIEGQRPGAGAVWQQNAREQRYRSWCGYAFENLCIKHIEGIKRELGISGIRTEISTYHHAGNDTTDGVQIDLLIDRADRCINLCEIKFYQDEFALGAEDALRLQRRRTRFVELSKTRKSVFLTLITTFGLRTNAHSSGLIDHVLTMDALFEQQHF